MDAQSAKPTPGSTTAPFADEESSDAVLAAESILLDQPTASSTFLGGAGVDPDTHALDDSDLLMGSIAGYDSSLFQELPPPPSLISTATLASTGMPSGFSPHKGRSAGTPLRSEAPPGIGDGDARLTFQLFDEKGEG
eukprot:352896_1